MSTVAKMIRKHRELCTIIEDCSHDKYVLLNETAADLRKATDSFRGAKFGLVGAVVAVLPEVIRQYAVNTGANKLKGVAVEKLLANGVLEEALSATNGHRLIGSDLDKGHDAIVDEIDDFFEEVSDLSNCEPETYQELFMDSFFRNNTRCLAAFLEDSKKGTFRRTPIGPKLVESLKDVIV